MTIQMLRAGPLLAVLALSLTGCSLPPGDVDSTPPPHRFERVTVSAPIGEAWCDDDGDGALEPCLSQRQLDALFNETIDALCMANDKLAWLSDYYLGTTLNPSCGEGNRNLADAGEAE